MFKGRYYVNMDYVIILTILQEFHAPTYGGHSRMEIRTLKRISRIF